EAELLYTIGTGDGSWGAFYPVSALWFLRCTIFGFGGRSLRTVTGLRNAKRLPHYGKSPKDDAGHRLPKVRFAGIQSLVEYLYYVPAPKESCSLHDSKRARLFTRSPVNRITKVSGGLKVSAERHEENYDYVFLTSPQWATQTSMRLSGFSIDELPPKKTTAQHTQHNISSCKLFFPLTKQYWRTGSKIPQVPVTDTFIQDAYALAWGSKKSDPGVLLASYTWEDDSLKLLPFSEQELVDLVTKELSRITRETVREDITDYIHEHQPVTLQWIEQQGYSGCAKLYRQGDEALNEIDLAYNQEYASRSRLYFAGENYSVEGGWTEPALRSALDGVLRLLHHEGAKFQVKDFDFERDYPRWNFGA
ncbi:MAG: FAD-dependent oxidoreductase, partial [Pseudomonadota bacterium]